MEELTQIINSWKLAYVSKWQRLAQTHMWCCTMVHVATINDMFVSYFLQQGHYAFLHDWILKT